MIDPAAQYMYGVRDALREQGMALLSTIQEVTADTSSEMDWNVVSNVSRALAAYVDTVRTEDQHSGFGTDIFEFVEMRLDEVESVSGRLQKWADRKDFPKVRVANSDLNAIIMHFELYLER